MLVEEHRKLSIVWIWRTFFNPSKLPLRVFSSRSTSLFHVEKSISIPESKSINLLAHRQRQNEVHSVTPSPTVNRHEYDPLHHLTCLDRPPSQADWLERSITQIDLFGRRHRGRLESMSKTDLTPRGWSSFFLAQTKRWMTISPVTHRKPTRNMTKNSKIDRLPRSNVRIDQCSTRFSIPELPSGEQLVFNLKSTWGDRHYVGLNGIEIFSSEGHPVTIKKVTTTFA